MQTPEEFLADNGFTVSSEIDRDAMIRVFMKEMEAGLKKLPSSLLMVNTFVGAEGRVAQGERVTVLDAGGTNFRGAVMEIPSTLRHKENRSMPGLKAEVGKDEFYRYFASEIERLDAIEKTDKIGWCFSYPAIATEEGDAKLVSWTKGIRASEIVGEYVGAELSKYVGGRKVIVVNDTVATLLAAKAIEGKLEYSSYIGFILGTGTNCAYVEKDLGGMIVNAESGAFDKIEQSAFDKSMDAKTTNPGKQIFEKMIAGAYLGPITLEVWKSAARGGYFTDQTAQRLGGIGRMETIDVDDFLSGVKRADRENPLMQIFTDAGDIRMAKRLGVPVFDRAATLTAIHLAAFAIKSGEGIDDQNPIAITADGSTWYKTLTVDFASVVKRELDIMLVKRRNIHYQFTPKIEDAPIIGAGIAALLK